MARGSDNAAPDQSGASAFDRRVVVFVLGERCYCVPIARVKEILRLERCARSDRGAMVARAAVGEAVVIDATARLGAVAAAPGPDGRVVVVRAHGGLVGFAVDRVLGVEDSSQHPGRWPTIEPEWLVTAGDMAAAGRTAA